MPRLRSSALLVLGFAACAVEEPAPPAEPPPAAVAIEDICDWWEPNDLTLTVRDSVMTPAGLAVICEQAGATASSVVVIDPVTFAKRDVYAQTAIEVDSIALADPETLLLGDTFGGLYTVPLAGGAPVRILEPRAAPGWLHAPTAIDGAVYFATARVGDAGATYAVEKLALAGGADRTPTVVAALPHYFNHLVATDGGLYAFGIGDDTLSVARIDVHADAPTPQMIVSRPRGAYEPLGFNAAVADHVFWVDHGGTLEPARYVEIRGSAITETDVPCPIDHLGSLAVGDELVQIAAGSAAACPGVVVMNRADGTVRRGRHLEEGWQESYRAAGLIGDRVLALEGDTRRTRLIVATLVPE